MPYLVAARISHSGTMQPSTLLEPSCGASDENVLELGEAMPHIRLSSLASGC